MSRGRQRSSRLAFASRGDVSPTMMVTTVTIDDYDDDDADPRGEISK